MNLIKAQYQNILEVDCQVSAEDGSWNRERIEREFAGVFKEAAQLEGFYKIKIDNSEKPVKLPKRKVPVALQQHRKEKFIEADNHAIGRETYRLHK